VPVALGITDNATPTYLNAMVAIGIVVGAGAAAKLVTLETVARCMPAGILIGVVVYTILMTWKRGREIVYTRMEANALPIELFIKSIGISNYQEVKKIHYI
jgi:K+ transporter